MLIPAVRSHALLLLVMLGGAFGAPEAYANEGRHAVAPTTRLVVALERNQMGAVSSVVRDVDPKARVVKRLGTSNVVVVSTARGGVMWKQLEDAPGVRYVERDRRMRALNLPINDPLTLNEMCHAIIGLAEAWGSGAIGIGATVAIVDTGVDATHPDLKDRMVPGRDFVDGDDLADDENGHGTHVAGIAAATAGNAEGIAGVAHDASIMPVRVLDADGTGWVSDVAEGVRWAADQHATVINLSLGSPTDSTILREAVEYADAQGANVVCAAGNEGENTLLYPAAYEPCISVGAIDPNTFKIADFSNHGPDLDLVAGGVSIMSSVPRGLGYRQLYERFSGTSMAAPHVAGAAAVLRSAGVAANDVGPHLKVAAFDLGAPGRDDLFGSGLLNVGAALNLPARPPANLRAWSRQGPSRHPASCGPRRPCTHVPGRPIFILGAASPARYVRGRNLLIVAQRRIAAGKWRAFATGSKVIDANGEFALRLPGSWARKGKVRVNLVVKDTLYTLPSRQRTLYFDVGIKQRPRPLEPTPVELSMIACVNEARAARGLAPLGLDPRLMSASRWFARDMALYDYLDHTDRLGRTLRQRLATHRYPRQSFVGEVLAAGSTTPAETMELWRDSSSHWSLLMNRRYTVAGIGHSYDVESSYGDYWTVDLGSVKGAGTIKPPADVACDSK